MSLKEIPKDKNVRNYLDTWIATNGRADPREMLDRYFWSYRSQNYYNTSSEIDHWCNEVIGQQNWHRMFNKYWFTSEEQLVMFKLTWGGSDGQFEF